MAQTDRARRPLGSGGIVRPDPRDPATKDRLRSVPHILGIDTYRAVHATSDNSRACVYLGGSLDEN